MLQRVCSRVYYNLLLALIHYSAMNVLRMIKLFGWENKMNEKVTDKRDKELIWVWRRQILDLINGNLKYVDTLYLFCSETQPTCSFLIPVVTMVATYTT